MWSLLLAVFAVVEPAVAKSPPAITSAEAMKRVQAYYVSVKKLKADFRQEYENAIYGRKSTSDGKVYIAKPGKMRWDYDKPEKKYFISDGTTLWVYEQEAKQAFKQGLADQILPVAITFLYGKGELAAEFEAALDPGKHGGKNDLVLRLTPKQPSAQYKNLWLVVDPGDFHVKESIVLEASGNLNRFAFANLKINDQAKFADKHFKFVPPVGVKVIEPEKQAPGGP